MPTQASQASFFVASIFFAQIFSFFEWSFSETFGQSLKLLPLGLKLLATMSETYAPPPLVQDLTVTFTGYVFYKYTCIIIVLVEP